jgi:hypothetical protein
MDYCLLKLLRRCKNSTVKDFNLKLFAETTAGSRDIANEEYNKLQ